MEKKVNTNPRSSFWTIVIISASIAGAGLISSLAINGLSVKNFWDILPISVFLFFASFWALSVSMMEKSTEEH
ncbi:MAG: hypothetical protein WC467_02010 [Patescibacteria group bacterium]